MRTDAGRSSCPIGKTLDLVGDKWSLLVMRHVIFAGCTTYKELSEMPEHIATNILTERLDRLEKAGILRRLPDARDGRKAVYKPTEKGIDLMPVLLAMIDWGMKYYRDASYPERLVRRALKNKPQLLAEARAL